MDAFELHVVFDFIDPDDLWEMWLHGESHAAMTGSPASGEPVVGSEFSAWDGYISGENVVLEPTTLIVQSWRTTHFAEDDEDSRLELRFSESDDGGSVLHLSHTNLPEGSGDDYLEGWQRHYFEPMHEFFESDD